LSEIIVAIYIFVSKILKVGGQKASVTQHPPVHHPKNPISDVLDGMKPNARDCPLQWGVFFFSFPPHPGPATVSSKDNPATYPNPLALSSQFQSLVTIPQVLPHSSEALPSL